MNKIDSIGFALDPANVPSFLLDWEVTKLCNLDCSYCVTGPEWGSHDNTTKHPPLDQCLESIDFMYNYVDLYMDYKKESQRKVVLNVYGGESLFHPDIVQILEACREKYQPFKNKWNLAITCTTNGVVGENHWERIVPLVDEFTMSYHSENLPKQKQQYLNNILYLKEHNKKFKCIIMMHNDPEMFEDSYKVVEFCQENKINFLAKAIDHYDEKFTYTKDQFDRLKTFWIKKESSVVNLEFNNRLSIL
jgi:MoaA/NifB/PqqE/SkfB family radical SAM enzyme